MKHLEDFVWMKKGADEPEQVAADVDLISQKMVAGYVQVFPETEEAPKEEN